MQTYCSLKCKNDYEAFQSLLNNKKQLNALVPYRSNNNIINEQNNKKSELEKLYCLFNNEKVCLNCGMIGHYE